MTNLIHYVFVILFNLYQMSIRRCALNVNGYCAIRYIILCFQSWRTNEYGNYIRAFAFLLKRTLTWARSIKLNMSSERLKIINPSRCHILPLSVDEQWDKWAIWKCSLENAVTSFRGFHYGEFAIYTIFILYRDFNCLISKSYY